MKLTRKDIKEIIKEEMQQEIVDPVSMGIGAAAVIAAPVVLKAIGSIVSKVGHKVFDFLEQKQIDDARKEMAAQELLIKTLPEKLMQDPTVAQAMDAYAKLPNGTKKKSHERALILNAIMNSLPNPSGTVARQVFNQMLGNHHAASGPLGQI